MANRAKLTDGTTSVEFDVLTSEQVQRSARVTDKTIEDGSIINDHIQFNPLTVGITALMTINAYSSLQRLLAFFNQKQILTYIGRNGVGTVVIESLDTNHPRENQGGFDFTMTLKQIRITTTQQVEVVPPAFVALPFKKRTGSRSNEGTQQKEEPGLDPGSENQVTSVVESNPQLNRIDQFLRERGY